MFKDPGINIVLLSVGLILGISDIHASEIDLDHLAKAVYNAEGGSKASVPYGLINDRWCIADDACRYYAKEVLRVHAARCQDTTDLIACIGSWYAPQDAHPLNRNWVRNVKYWYQRLDE